MNAVNKMLFEKALKQYHRLVEEGWDVVLPPEPIVPISARYASAGNYGVQKSQVGAYVRDVVAKHGLRQRVHIIVLDTGAKSQSDYISRNFLDLGKDHTPENQPIDTNGHFTFCASQVCGRAESNPLGILGSDDLIWNNDFWTYSGEKLLRANGVGTYGEIMQGLEGALDVADHLASTVGARVIFSCSWGGGGTNAAITNIFKEIRDRGHFVFAAAGNSGSQGINFPANIPADALGEVLFSIGAIDQNDKVASFSSRGDSLDFCQYGVSNMGAGPGKQQIAVGSGTSYATPLAVGCAALLLGCFPEIQNMADLEYVLGAGAVNLGEKSSYGKGLIRMNEYSDEDLPGGNPPDDDPNEDPNEDPVENPVVFPERKMIVVSNQIYEIKWAVMDPAGLQSGVLDSGPLFIDWDSSIAAAYDWKSLYLTDVQAELLSTDDAATILMQWIDFLEEHWPDGRRGVLMPYPADFASSGEAALMFARMFAERAGWKASNFQAAAHDNYDDTGLSGFKIKERQRG